MDLRYTECDHCNTNAHTALYQDQLLRTSTTQCVLYRTTQCVLYRDQHNAVRVVSGPAQHSACCIGTSTTQCVLYWDQHNAVRVILGRTTQCVLYWDQHNAVRVVLGPAQRGACIVVEMLMLDYIFQLLFKL